MVAFNAIQEARLSYIYVLKNFRIFLRIGGPWVITTSVITFSILLYANNNQEGHIKQGMTGALAVIASILAISLTFPVFMLSWHRFVLLEKYPLYGVFPPGRATWSFLWRWWFVSNLLSTFDKTILPAAPKLAGMLGLADATLIHNVLGVFVYLFALLFVSLYALGLPAIVVGDQAALRSATKSRARLGRSFGLGMAVSAILYPATDLLPSASLFIGPYAIAGCAALSIVSAVAQYFGLAVVSTYLCRAFVITHPGYGSDRMAV